MPELARRAYTIGDTINIIHTINLEKQTTPLCSTGCIASPAHSMSSTAEGGGLVLKANALLSLETILNEILLNKHIS